MPCATSAGHAASCFTGPCRHFMRAIACRSDGRAKRTDGVVASRAAASFSKGLGQAQNLTWTNDNMIMGARESVTNQIEY